MYLYKPNEYFYDKSQIREHFNYWKQIYTKDEIKTITECLVFTDICDIDMVRELKDFIDWKRVNFCTCDALYHLVVKEFREQMELNEVW